MSRSGYNDDCGGWELNLWRGAVASAIKGKRGQAFLRELLFALEGMSDKRLIAHELQDEEGQVCAIGRVGQARGTPMSDLDPTYSDAIAKRFGVAEALVKELEFINDDDFGFERYHGRDTPEDRWRRVHAWVKAHIHV